MKRLYKSSTDRKIDGVCAGIANYFNIDPTAIRVLWAIITLFTVGVGILAYVACALIMPVEPDYIDQGENN